MSQADTRYVRTTIRMNEELARRAKKYAARNKRTFTQVIEEALTNLLAPAKQPATRPRIVLPTSGNANGAKMTDAQYRALLVQMYDKDAERVWSAGHGPARR